MSGLLAAWHLQRRGLEIEVWEASPAVGGWAQTLSWPGPQGEPGFLERGPQSLRVGRGSALARLLRELNLELRPSSPKGPRWLGKEGRRHPSPATIIGLLQAPGIGPGDWARMLVEPFIPTGNGADETLHAFFARRLGTGFARELLPALVAGVLAAPPERISAGALPRLRRLEAMGGLLIGGLRAGPEHDRLPLGGTGALARALATAVGCVRTRRPALALEPLPGGRWRIHCDSLISDTDAVVLALPSPVVSELLGTMAPVAAQALEAIPRLDLRVWHSRHAMVKGWERGIGLLIHPPEGRGLLGAVNPAAPSRQARPFDELHRVPERVALAAGVPDPDDRRVVEACGDPRFLAEALEGIGVGAGADGHDLQGLDPSAREVPHLQDGRVTAGPDGLEDLVPAPDVELGERGGLFGMHARILCETVSRGG